MLKNAFNITGRAVFLRSRFTVGFFIAADEADMFQIHTHEVVVRILRKLFKRKFAFVPFADLELICAEL
jgi:hypothetical protein